MKLIPFIILISFVACIIGSESKERITIERANITFGLTLANDTIKADQKNCSGTFWIYNNSIKTKHFTAESFPVVSCHLYNSDNKEIDQPEIVRRWAITIITIAPKDTFKINASFSTMELDSTYRNEYKRKVKDDSEIKKFKKGDPECKQYKMRQMNLFKQNLINSYKAVNEGTYFWKRNSQSALIK